MKNIKVGIIGMGRIGKIHLENLSTRIDGVEVVAVVNPSKTGQEYATNFGVQTVSNNPDILFENSEIDAIRTQITLFAQPLLAKLFFVKNL